MAKNNLSTLSGRRVFVAEDEGLIAFDIVSLLEGAGCRVIGPAADLSGALQTLETARVDMALLDVNLRGEMVWPIAETLQSRGVPFLFLTGYASLDDFPPEFVDVPRLDKPFVASELLGLVARLCGSEHARLVEPQCLDAPELAPLSLALPRVSGQPPAR